MTNDTIEKFYDIYKQEGFASKVLKCFIQEEEPKHPYMYEKDIGTPSFFISKNSKDISKISEKETMFNPDMFELIGEGETLEEAIKDFIKKDTLLCIRLMFVAADSGNQVFPIKELWNAEGLRFKEIFEDIQYSVERHRLLADKFIMGPDLLYSFKENLKEDTNKEITDDAIESDISGVCGKLWGVDLYLEPLLCFCVFSVTEGRYLGVRNIKEVTYKNNKLNVTGLMGLFNSRSVSCAIDRKYSKSNLDLKEIDILYNKGESK